MFRLIIVAVFIFTPVLANAQTPGVDPRGLMIHSSTVIIGVVEEPWQRVIQPDRIPKGGAKVIAQADGTYIVELLPISRDFMVGYIYHVRVQEVLKGDQWVRKNQIIQIFVPDSLEGGASLATNQRFLLALARFEPKKEVFANTSVGRVGEPLTRPGVAFDLRARYYQVASDRNGAIAITDKNLKFIEEIKSAIRNGPYWFHRFSFRRGRILGFAGSPQIIR
ncbi:MAG TPA: hypothetical protein VMM84_05920 [Pyrinomonadaceae bacterium]|nr:hypothetical protein [Pyrinomonadaceae bacterium]